MEAHGEIAVKFRLRLVPHIQHQAGDLVFVLIGQQFVIALGHRFLQPRILCLIDQCQIAGFQRRVLVIHQIIGAIPDNLLQRFGLVHHHRRYGLGRILGEFHRPATDFKGAFVALNRRLVQFNRRHDRVIGQRQQPALPRRPDDHHVGKNTVAQQSAGQFRGVEFRQISRQTRL